MYRSNLVDASDPTSTKYRSAGVALQRWISGNAHYIRLHIANKAPQPIMTLKPRTDVTRNPKLEYQWPTNKDM